MLIDFVDTMSGHWASGSQATPTLARIAPFRLGALGSAKCKAAWQWPTYRRFDFLRSRHLDKLFLSKKWTTNGYKRPVKLFAKQRGRMWAFMRFLENDYFSHQLKPSQQNTFGDIKHPMFNHFLAKHCMSQDFSCVPRMLFFLFGSCLTEKTSFIGTSKFWHTWLNPEVLPSHFWNRTLKRILSHFRKI